MNEVRKSLNYGGKGIPGSGPAAAALRMSMVRLGVERCSGFSSDSRGKARRKETREGGLRQPRGETAGPAVGPRCQDC